MSRRTTIPLATRKDTVSGRQTTLKHRTQYGWIYALRSCRANEVSTTEYGLIAAAAVVAVAVLVEATVAVLSLPRPPYPLLLRALYRLRHPLNLPRFQRLRPWQERSDERPMGGAGIWRECVV